MHIFTRVKFDRDQDDAKLLAEIKKRFQKTIPMKHVDVVFVQSVDPPKEIEEVNDDEEEIERNEGIEEEKKR